MFLDAQEINFSRRQDFSVGKAGVYVMRFYEIDIMGECNGKRIDAYLPSLLDSNDPSHLYDLVQIQICFL